LAGIFKSEFSLKSLALCHRHDIHEHLSAIAESGAVVALTLRDQSAILAPEAWDRKYLVINELYIQGLMNGDAVGMMNEAKLASKIF
jgi:hypothetical protein